MTIAEVDLRRTLRQIGTQHGGPYGTAGGIRCQCGFTVGGGVSFADHITDTYAAALQPLIDAEKRAAVVEVLAAFARHDLHGLLPYADIGNPWYHRGIDAAQHEALEWSEARRDALTTKDA